MEFSDSAKEELRELLSHYPDRQAVTVPALFLAMREFGCVNDEVFDYLGSITEIPPIHFKDTASFYIMFRGKEIGKYVIEVCHSISCSLLGASHLVEYLKKKLHINVGETTPDKKFTLIKVECLASCGTAPVMSINGTYYENLTFEKIDEILENLK